MAVFNHIFLALAMVALLAAGGRLAAEEVASPPDFNAAVAPILKKYCVGCHNSTDKEGGLILESYEQLLAGGQHGAVVKVASADESRLVKMLTGKIEPAMPPEGSERPGDAEIAILRAWIDAGAKSPEGKAPDPNVVVAPRIPTVGPVRQAINAAAWSPDGKLLALAGYREVRLVAADSRAPLRKLANLTGNVTDLAYSADSRLLVTAGGEPGLFGEAQLWDVESGLPVRSFKGNKDSLYAVALSADNAVLATAGYDGEIIVWDVASGTQRGKLSGHSGAVFDLAFGREGRLLASASADRTIKLWDVAALKRLDTFGQPLHEQYTVAFSPDGRRVAGGGVDNRIRVWQISETAQEGTNPIVFSRFAHQSAIVKLAWSPDGKSLVSAAEDRLVRVWDADTLTERRLLEPQPDWAPALAFSPDSKRVVAGRLDGSFQLYDAASGEIVPPPRPELAMANPRGIQRGTSARIGLAGKNLLDASRLEFSDPKLSAEIVRAGADEADRLTAQITAGADLPRGAYEVAVVTPGGTSEKLKLHVDDIPQLSEAEPNNLPSQSALAALPASFWGVLAVPGDTDEFAFEAAPGQTIVFEVAAKSLGSKLDAVLTLFDAAGHVVASDNDFEGSADPLLAYTIPANSAPSRYTVRVSDLTQAGSAEHFYRLSAGPFPYVTGCFPLSVPAGHETQIELAGYNLPPAANVSVTAGANGEVPVPIDANRFRSRRAFSVVVGSLSEVVESEPNDEPATATPLALPATIGGRIWSTATNQLPSEGAAKVAGQIERSADVDLYRFASKAGAPWIIETDAARRGSPIDTVVEVLDAAGKPIPRVLLQATRDSAITFRGINSQTVDVRVENWEEMELNQLLYLQGEVCKIFRLPQGPDSGFNFYSSAGDRVCYFDTSGTTHAVDETCYIVEPHAPGTTLVSNGLPVFPLYYTNDDDGLRKLGRDSRLTFTAPADGDYLLRVADVRGMGGDRFAYRVTVREPRPDFNVSINGLDPAVKAGSGRNLTIAAERIDNFDGEITVEISGLPPGFSVSSPIVIQAGHQQASAVIYAAPDAPKPTEENAAATRVVARATINGSPVEKPVKNLGHIKLAPKGNVLVRLEPAEITIAPGTSVAATLKVERNGFDGKINFSVENLPHGVIVDNIGLNGVLIPEKQTERQIFLTARAWVPETSRLFHAIAADVGSEASPPVLLHVRRPATVAQAPGK